MAKLNMVQAVNLALAQEMESDPTVLVMGQDVAVDGGVFRATEGLLDKFGAMRVVDTPLAESGIVGGAVGMAIAGLKPVCEMQFSGFSYMMMGQFEAHVTRMRSRTHGQLNLPMVIRMPFGGGVRALEHHSESREVLYAHQPGARVVIPSGPRNARALLVAAIRDPDPVVFMEPKHSYRAFREEVPDESETLPIGKAQVVQEGTDLTLISWGAMMRPTLKAAATVEKERGASIEIIDLLTIAPLDHETIAASVSKTGRCVVVQEAPRSFGPSSEITAVINDKAFWYLEAPVKRLTGYDVVTPYFGREKSYLPNADQVVRGIVETLDA
ncbi:alpha-ketoacid dehydrogenase subunit beta [bacterium]|nr:alpha-ketoacid dehydrogenase subunit beta [bacterium]PJA73152.1 MAG: alpha-ketoacid dehydrogenase subunit beta [bacterium CG_4_9_14_3_um_filter_65_15]